MLKCLDINSTMFGAVASEPLNAVSLREEEMFIPSRRLNFIV
jgi:hypothetical protein